MNAVTTGLDLSLRLDPALKADWIEALPTYEQGFGRLRDEDGGYCCLGVFGCVLKLKHDDLLQEVGWDFDIESGIFSYIGPEENEHGERIIQSDMDCSFPDDLAARIGLIGGEGVSPQDSEICLVNLNDIEHWSFSQMAAYIEKWY